MPVPNGLPEGMGITMAGAIGPLGVGLLGGLPGAPFVADVYVFDALTGLPLEGARVDLQVPSRPGQVVLSGTTSGTGTGGGLVEFRGEVNPADFGQLSFEASKPGYRSGGGAAGYVSTASNGKREYLGNVFLVKNDGGPIVSITPAGAYGVAGGGGQGGGGAGGGQGVDGGGILGLRP